jgi:hypothetical protein
MRRTSSRTQFVLDEAATAQRIADADQTARLGAWLPVLSPSPERWLEVVLAVDESPSMAVWERTVAEFGRLLERQGAFRRVQLWGLRPDAGRLKVELYAGTGLLARRGRPRQPRELIDLQGRRLILVASDCVAPTWHNGAMAALLAGWGRQGPVALIQMLPHPLWVRTGLRTFPSTLVRAAQAGVPNSQLEIRWPSPLPVLPHDFAGVPVPVFTLQAGPVAQWARALAGNSGLWLPAVLAISARDCASPSLPGDRDDLPAAARPTTEELLRIFAATASPPARELAAYLAAVPLTLPIMRLVQRVMTPGANQVHLAEVFLSGLVRRLSPGSGANDETEYDFVTGARPLLLNDMHFSNTMNVLRAVSDHVNRVSGQPLDFPALLADSTATGDLKLTGRQERRFAEVAAAALRRFGGRFAKLAARLEVTVQGVAPSSTTPTRPQVSPPRRKRGGARAAVTVHALLVGIDKYASAGIPALRGCVNDALAIKAALLRRFGVHRANVTTLLNQRATRAAVARAWQDLAQRVKPGDQVFFLFSGHGTQERSADPSDVDGFAESLIAHDSRLEGVTAILTPELSQWAALIEGRGVQVILFLDTTHAGSGFFARRAAGNWLVLAACRESEQSYEHSDSDSGGVMGAATFFLLEALKDYRPGMTWGEVHDRIFANVKTRYSRQTPQLIGPGDLVVFGNERRATRPHLLVLARTGPLELASDLTIRVNASAALHLQPGATLAISPPDGDPLERAVAFAHIIGIEEDHVVAEVHAKTIPVPASCVEVLSFGGGQTLLRVGLDTRELPVIPSGPFTLVPPNDPTAEFHVRL